MHFEAITEKMFEVKDTKVCGPEGLWYSDATLQPGGCAVRNRAHLDILSMTVPISVVPMDASRARSRRSWRPKKVRPTTTRSPARRVFACGGPHGRGASCWPRRHWQPFPITRARRCGLQASGRMPRGCAKQPRLPAGVQATCKYPLFGKHRADIEFTRTCTAMPKRRRPRAFIDADDYARIAQRAPCNRDSRNKTEGQTTAMPTILATGATGNIGRELVHLLKPAERESGPLT